MHCRYSASRRVASPPHSRALVGSVNQATLKQLQELTGAEKNDLVFPGTRNYWRPISENMINKALRVMGYGTDELCGHGFRTMACGALIQSGLWQEDAVERQMSHKERNSVRLAYSHAAEFLQERRLMMQWWADYLDANRLEHVTPFDYAHTELGAEEHAGTVVAIKRSPSTS